VSLTIRRAAPGDTPRLQELNEVALRGVDAYAEEAAEGDLDDLESAYFDAGGAFLIGERDGEIAAMGAIKPVGPDTWMADRLVDPGGGFTAEITRMRVDPDHQRRGYGSRLLEALESRARDLGFEALTLDTTARQEGARALYESYGYRRLESFEWREYEVLIYRKELTP